MLFILYICYFVKYDKSCNIIYIHYIIYNFLVYIFINIFNVVVRNLLAVIPITRRHCSRTAIFVCDLRHNQSRKAGGAVKQPRRRPSKLPTPAMYSAGKRQSNLAECENLHHTARYKILLNM